MYNFLENRGAFRARDEMVWPRPQLIFTPRDVSIFFDELSKTWISFTYDFFILKTQSTLLRKKSTSLTLRYRLKFDFGMYPSVYTVAPNRHVQMS